MGTAIEELLDLLRAAAGEASLGGALGRWRQAVSTRLGEAQQAIGAVQVAVGQIQQQLSHPPQPSPLPDYGWVKRGGSPQVGVTTGTNVVFTSVGPIRGISYTDRWTLKPGKTYVLRLLGTFENFSNGDGEIQLKFTDDTNTPLTDPTADSPSGIWFPVTANVQSSSGPGLEMVYQTPPTFSGLCIVRVLCTTATGDADVRQGGMTMTVEEIPGGV